MSVSRIRMYPAKSHIVNSCAPWINPHLKVLFWQIVDRIILIFTAQSKLVLPFMAKCSNVTGWRYNMRYLSIYERWKFKQIRKQAEHRLFRWVFLYHILTSGTILRCASPQNGTSSYIVLLEVRSCTNFVDHTIFKKIISFQ